jgi:hypothetical protein
MSKYKVYSIFTLCILLTIKAIAQLPVGQWREHLPYALGQKVSETENKIYCSTKGGLFTFDKNDNSVEKISKITGLSDVGISSLKYSTENNVLLIAYSNANIDIIEGTDIFNISDVKRKQMTGRKTINNILFIDEYAYLSCAFGIVVLNLEKKEIADTYYIGQGGDKIEVFELAFHANSHMFYAATENGIFSADKDNPNLVDYNNWSLITDVPNFDKKFNTICSFNNKIYANYSSADGVSDAIYVFDGDSWSDCSLSTNFTRKLTNSYERLIIVLQYNVRVYDYDENMTHNIWTYRFEENPSPQARDAIFDVDNIIWVADYRHGLIKKAPGFDFESIHPNGPAGSVVVDIDVSGDHLWSVKGGVSASWNNLFNHGELYTFFDEQWSSHVLSDTRDMFTVVIDPTNPNHVFSGSWGYGVFEFLDQELVANYNETNSTLQTIIPGHYCRIGGLAFDNQHNLWVTNADVANTISVLKADGQWKSFEYGSIMNANTIGEIIITRNNHKWIILPHLKGLFAFDDNNTIDDTSDDRHKKFIVTNTDGKTISDDIYSIAEDLDGSIWVGTNQGIAVYYNPSEIFSPGIVGAQQIIILDQDSVAHALLETETVTAIAIDGANRKWLGTAGSGLYLMSEDGTEQIHHFNLDNSPILSNNISAVTINQSSGEVFIGTDVGIISFRSTATEGNEFFRDVYAFPNPVREDYDGVITIKGLVTNANVKITDISGNIVFETTAYGGQAIWDGNNFSGQRVHTGVYLIFCTNEDGSKTFVTKLLFIN